MSAFRLICVLQSLHVGVLVDAHAEETFKPKEMVTMLLLALNPAPQSVSGKNLQALASNYVKRESGSMGLRTNRRAQAPTSSVTYVPDISFGVEFEFAIPGMLLTTRDDDVDGSLYGTRLRGIVKEKENLLAFLRANGFPDISHTEGTLNKWVLTEDRTAGYEVVSPILSGADGLYQVATMCAALANLGAICNDNCGLHVHVDANDIDHAHMADLVLLHDCLEQHCGLLDCVTSRRHDNHNCKQTDYEVLDKAARLGEVKCQDVIHIDDKKI
jgi:hypothetical protein